VVSSSLSLGVRGVSVLRLFCSGEAREGEGAVWAQERPNYQTRYSYIITCGIQVFI